MARPKKTTKPARRTVHSQVRSSKKAQPSLFQRLQSDLDLKHSYVNLILGALIVIVLAILGFNYFTRQKGELTQNSAQTGEQITVVPSNPPTADQSSSAPDTSKDNLPGKYTVKSGDTLYAIALKYYGDGFQFSQLASANSLTDPDTITPGQVLEIPKLDQSQADTAPRTSPALNANTQPVQGGTGGAVNQTEWGTKIDGDTYTVQAGDWLSTIAGRAYGDIMSFSKIAQANNIANPNLIEPGTVLKIPR